MPPCLPCSVLTGRRFLNQTLFAKVFSRLRKRSDRRFTTVIPAKRSASRNPAFLGGSDPLFLTEGFQLRLIIRRGTFFPANDGDICQEFGCRLCTSRMTS